MHLLPERHRRHKQLFQQQFPGRRRHPRRRTNFHRQTRCCQQTKRKNWPRQSGHSPGMIGGCGQKKSGTPISEKMHEDCCRDHASCDIPEVHMTPDRCAIYPPDTHRCHHDHDGFCYCGRWSVSLWGVQQGMLSLHCFLQVQ